MRSDRAALAQLKMSDFRRQVKDEISKARNRTLMLAMIASFIAWITHLLRLAFGVASTASLRGQRCPKCRALATVQNVVPIRARFE